MSTMSNQPYAQSLQFAATLRSQTIQIVTKPGFPHWDEVSPAANLLADSLVLLPNAHIFHLGCGHGGLGVFLARSVPQGEVLLLDANYAAVTMAAQTLARNHIGNARVLGDPPDPSELPNSCTVAVMELPAGRSFARRWLALAHAALAPGGHLYLAGPKAEGIESVISDARALFGSAATLAYRDHNRVAVATKAAGGHQPPDWAEEPGIRPGTWRDVPITINERPSTLASLPGIFSFDRLDDGTALLLATLTNTPGLLRRTDRVLDLGCGYGIIGLTAAHAGAQQVDLVDVSLPAVAASARNIAAARLPNARAWASDAYSAIGDARYDLIVTNPPFHAGKRIDYAAAQTFIADAHHHLAPHGRLIVVANGFIRYERAMRAAFGTAELIAENRRYQVLQAALR